MPDKQKSPNNIYVMFGYNTSNIDEVGFFGKDLTIVKDKEDAMEFPLKNVKRRKGFGTPTKWLEYINSDSVSHGYKFHLVLTTKKQCSQQD